MWYEPEYCQYLEAEDTRLERKTFYVYLLKTAYGHYVGHTSDITSRMKTHKAGKCISTAKGRPRLIWSSNVFHTRQDAARFEAALKSWRDNEQVEFKKRTGWKPIPFSTPVQRGLYLSRQERAAIPSRRLADWEMWDDTPSKEKPRVRNYVPSNTVTFHMPSKGNNTTVSTKRRTSFYVVIFVVVLLVVFGLVVDGLPWED